MAGTLVISTLSDGTNSTSSTNCIKGSAKAWVEYNGVANSVLSSYNVGSVTKNGTGDYTINFSSAMSSTAYSVMGSANDPAGGNAPICWTFSFYTPSSASSVRTNVRKADNNVADGGICAAIFSA